MLRSRFFWTWSTREKQHEDRALLRLDRLEAVRQAATKAPVPVFFARKPRLA